MAAAEKSFWVQVMEAGFGATLEAHGFRRVSPRLYRLEGDGVIWEQLTYRGYNGFPNSVRDCTGAVIPGSEEIFQKAFGKNPRAWEMLPLRHWEGGRRYDTSTSIAQCHDDLERERLNAREPKTRLGRILRFNRPRSIVQLHDKIKKNYLLWYDGCWVLGDLSVEELADLMSRYWVEYVWGGHLSNSFTLRDLVDRIARAEPCWRIYDVDDALYNHLAGRHEIARNYLMYAIRLSEMTFREIRDRTEKYPSRVLREMSEDDPAREDTIVKICKAHEERAERYAMQARRLAAVLDIDLSPTRR